MWSDTGELEHCNLFSWLVVSMVCWCVHVSLGASTLVHIHLCIARTGFIAAVMASGFFGYLIGLCSFWCVNRMRTESESKVSSRTSPQTTFSPWHHANLKRTQKQTAPTPTASHVRTTSDSLCQVRPANIADYVQHRRHRQQGFA